MKRLLNIIVLLCLTWQLAPAQDQTQDQDLEQPTFVTNVSYIYRNDDHFHGFADDEVDSIKFSRIDADGIEHVDYVTQVVYTPDSIYRIPLATVDSVVCQQPKMELQKDVVMLTEEQRGFVIRADSTTILFRSDTPRDLIPERGEVLLALNYGNQSTLQFTGRVLRTERTAEGVLVTCNPDVQLGDIFRRFTAVMFTSPGARAAGSDQEWEVPHDGNRENIDPFSSKFQWKPSTRTYKDPDTGETITYSDKYISGYKDTFGDKSKKKNLLDFMKDKPSWLEEGVEVGVGVQFTFAYRQKFLIDFFYDKDDWVIPSLYFYWRPTMLPSFEGEIELKIEKEWGTELTFLPDLKPIGIWTPPAPPVPPIRVGELNIHVSPLYVRFGGEASVTYGFELKKLFDIGIERKDWNTKITDMTKNGGYTDKSGLYSKGFKFAESDLGDNVDHIGSVYFWFAWNPSFGISVITEKVLTANAEVKVGPWLQLNFEKAKETTDENARFYQMWTPSHFMTKLHIEGDFSVTIGKKTSVEKKFSVGEKLKEWNMTDGKGWDFMVRRYGIFPAFGKPQLSSGWEQSLTKRGVISFTTPYKNPNHGDPAYDKLTHTFLSADLGLGIYKVNTDGTQTEVARSLSPKKEKGWFNSDEGKYSTEFKLKDLKRGIYKVAPLFDAACFSPMRATPTVDVVIPPNAVTEEVTGIAKHHCYMNGYGLGLKSFSEEVEGEVRLGWICKKANESGGHQDNALEMTNNDLVDQKTFTLEELKSETVNGEDKLIFSSSRCNNLRPATTYIYRTWATYGSGSKQEVIYGDIMEFTTEVDDEQPRCVTDLGLSVDWACYNVGAAKEYDYGKYFAWGEKSAKKEYSAKTYKLPSKSNIAGDTDYDVATTWNNKQNKGWRMPTKDEIQELIDNCDMEWVTVHGKKGMKFTSKINGKSIFLPAAGNKYGEKTYSNGIGGCYWSGDIDSQSLMEEVQYATGGDGDSEVSITITPPMEDEHNDDVDLGDGDNKKLTREERADAWRLHFNNVDVDNEDKDPHNEAGRCYYGRTIRPVREKQKDEEQ